MLPIRRLFTKVIQFESMITIVCKMLIIYSHLVTTIYIIVTLRMCPLKKVPFGPVNMNYPYKNFKSKTYILEPYSVQISDWCNLIKVDESFGYKGSFCHNLYLPKKRLWNLWKFKLFTEISSFSTFCTHLCLVKVFGFNVT